MRSWCYLAVGRVRPVVLAIVLAVPCAATAKQERLESACHSLLHRYVLDCGCTAKFLEDHFGTEQADILLKLWVYGVKVTIEATYSISTCSMVRTRSTRP